MWRPRWRDWARAYAAWDDRTCAWLAARFGPSRWLTAFGLVVVWACLFVVALVYAKISGTGSAFPLATAAAMGVAVVPLFRRRMREQLLAQRERDGQCPDCGYDLRASAGRCPECGGGTGY